MIGCPLLIIEPADAKTGGLLYGLARRDTKKIIRKWTGVAVRCTTVELMKSVAFALVAFNFALIASAQDTVIKPPEECISCASIVVRGRLARILEISDCNGASGMTCRIRFKRGELLPSRIKVQQMDEQNRVIGKKFLPYPNLKPEEKGWATFPTGSAATVVLVGEWKGPWQSSY